MIRKTRRSSGRSRLCSRRIRSSGRCSSGRERTTRASTKAESEQIVDAIQKNGGSVTYVVYSDEGHGFARPENSIDFNARAENFLSGCLGGRAEAISGGERYPGSTAAVRVIQQGKEVTVKTVGRSQVHGDEFPSHGG